jgi:hypothetical protein
MMTARWSSSAPRQPQRRYSYNESVDEPANLIEDEPVDIQQETPAQESEPVERIEERNGPRSPAFEE